MPKITPGPDIRIAAMEKKKVELANLMQPGAGTPWEDRGSTGAIKAFFATCVMGLKSPVKLLSSIRRPETPSDARGFMIGCGVMWGIGAIVQSVLLRLHWGADWEPDGFRIGVAVLAILSVVIVYLMHALATAMLTKMNSVELGARAPSVLTYNVLSYVLSPSLLAPIPVIGPAVAGIWIVCLGIVACTRRLKLKVATAIINVLLTTVVVLLCVSVMLLVARLLFGGIMRYFD
ncbi:MAG TPA: hypothetical protein VH518_23055 [Tepidisphaeraceae bacterium]|jgi:hypothetical protein